jgi:hypothetical protein
MKNNRKNETAPQIGPVAPHELDGTVCRPRPSNEQLLHHFLSHLLLAVVRINSTKSPIRAERHANRSSQEAQ